jgi:NAD(P)-dependent dehydrogenase (short-subunit alcohol dehydrogenase family)
MPKRAALVTGASSGIGLAIAQALAEDGYGVTVSARRPEKLEDAASGLSKAGFDVSPVTANIAKEDQIKALAAAHRDRYGRLDVLVNNAGIGIGSEVAEVETKRLDLQLDVNLRGAFLMTREAVPMLRESGREHGKALLVNMSSIAGKHGQPWLAAYSATKAALVALSQATQGEIEHDGVQVTAFCPGFVATPMTDWNQGVPKEEMIQPEDLAEAVRFLLRTSTHCLVPEMQFLRPGDRL